MFIPLLKADAAQRMVYGSFDETPDRSGEVCDYATAKPAFEGWSNDMVKASGGKSMGNIRAQHDLKKAAGKLVELSFDDDAKRIDFAAKIVDDAEWLKVEEGVYTGFSPGGRYAKRWQDGAHRRYTPVVGELSIVDVPCNPAATFTMVKADGAEETIGFVLDKAYEPGNDATKARAEEMAKAAGTTGKAKDYVAQARADLIRENADAELAKLAPAALKPAPPAADPLGDALAKADAALAAAEPQGDLPEPFRDFAQASAAIALIGGDDTLAKGMWQVRSAASLLQELSYLQADAAYEAKGENDGSAVPANLADVVKRMGAIVVAMAQEEVAELIATMPAETPIVVVDGDPIVMELASNIVDLVKADEGLMAKAGARNSKKDAATVQEMHDSAVKLGATCDADAAKVADLSAENERLTKAVGDAVPRVERLATTVERLTADAAAKDARIAELLTKAAPPKGAVLEVPRTEDTPLGKVVPSIASPVASIAAAPEGRDRTRAIEAAARQMIASR